MHREDVAIILVDRDYAYETAPIESSFVFTFTKDIKEKIQIMDRAIEKIKTKKGFTRFCNWMIGKSKEKLDDDCWLMTTQLKSIEYIIESEYTNKIRYLYIKNIDKEKTVDLTIKRFDDILNPQYISLRLVPGAWRKFVGSKMY